MRKVTRHTLRVFFGFYDACFGFCFFCRRRKNKEKKQKNLHFSDQQNRGVDDLIINTTVTMTKNEIIFFRESKHNPRTPEFKFKFL